MKQYLNILEEILENGVKREDRTGVGTLSIFGTQTRYDLSKGFPLLTTKKLFTRGIIEEIIDKYHVRVRIPEHNGLQGRDRGTPTSELGIATICCPPGHVPHYRVGDIVFVAYERGNISMPVIIGLISGANSHYISSDIDTDNLRL